MSVSEQLPVTNHRGNNSNTRFDFDFYIENESQLLVTHTDLQGIVTFPVWGVDYSINEVGMQEGSYINFPLEDSKYKVLGVDKITGEREVLSISLNLPIEQPATYNTSGDLNKKNLEYSFDYLTRLIQILSRKVARSVKVAEGSNIDTDELAVNLNTIAEHINNVDIVASDVENINAVVDNKNHIDTVAGSIGYVNKIGNDIENLLVVASDLDNIDAVVSNKKNIDTVSESMVYVKNVGNDINNVNRVADGLANIDAVVNNKNNIDAVAGSISSVERVGNDIERVGNVAGDLTNIDSVANNRTNINKVAGSIDSINRVSENVDSINNAVVEAQNVISGLGTETNNSIQAIHNAEQIAINNVLGETTYIIVRDWEE